MRGDMKLVVVVCLVGIEWFGAMSVCVIVKWCELKVLYYGRVRCGVVIMRV